MPTDGVARSAQVLKFVRTWLAVIGDERQVLVLWTLAVQKVNSWSFLLHSLDAIARSLRISAEDEAAGVGEFSSYSEQVYSEVHNVLRNAGALLSSRRKSPPRLNSSDALK